MTIVEKQLGPVIAVDLGSNSFHLLEAYFENGQLFTLATLQQKVQLSLNMRDTMLSEDAIDRGHETLRSFATYTKGRSSSAVCIVATQALRLAKNSSIFCKKAQEILGHPVNIISGEQEAKLVYNAVTYEMERGSRQLVIDIGGGSTELALGCGQTVEEQFSLPIGCVNLLKHFPEGAITSTAIGNAYIEACQYIQPIIHSLQDFDVMIGCSGTLGAVDDVLSILNGAHSGIGRGDMSALITKLLECRNIETLNLEGLSEDRRSVFVPGVAIVLALFDSFNIEHMDISTNALREGVALNIIAKTGTRIDL